MKNQFVKSNEGGGSSGGDNSSSYNQYLQENDDINMSRSNYQRGDRDNIIRRRG